MKTKSSPNESSSSVPVAFRSEFNHFENITATQAWSLFFTGSKEDTSLGASLGAGRLWNLLLIGVVVTSIIGILIF